MERKGFVRSMFIFEERRLWKERANVRISFFLWTMRYDFVIRHFLSFPGNVCDGGKEKDTPRCPFRTDEERTELATWLKEEGLKRLSPSSSSSLLIPFKSC